MYLADIKQLIATGEGPTLEFKRKINYPEKVVRELVAFANTDGGHLLVGVEDDGTLRGLSNPEEHDFALQKAIKDLCAPKLKYKITFIPLSKKKSILCYTVKEAYRKPCFAKENAIDRYGRAYVRVADKTLQASREMVQVLKKCRTNRNFSFRYGEKETVLMKYLDTHGSISLRVYKELAGIPTKVASSTLVVLVLAGVLRIIPGEKGDRFRLKNF